MLAEHARYSAFAHQTLAQIKLDQGDPAEALELLERGFLFVLEVGSRFEQGLFRAEQARALVALGRLEEAEESARRALELFEGGSQGDASRVRAVIGEIHERRGEIDEAIDAYREAAETAPQTARYKAEAYAKLAELLKQAGRSDEAVDVLTQAPITQGRSLTKVDSAS